MPGSWVGRTFPDVEMYEDIARIAERGCLDMLFSGDGTGVPSTWRGSQDEAVYWGIAWPRQDMSPLFTAMSRVTKSVGFGLTYASTFMHPYYVARLLNSLDNITNGRIAFNVIASARRADAANYGFNELMGRGTSGWKSSSRCAGSCGMASSRTQWRGITPPGRSRIQEDPSDQPCRHLL